MRGASGGNPVDAPRVRGMTAKAKSFFKRMLDSGATFDMVGEETIPKWQKKLAYESDMEYTLSTANGDLPVSRRVPMRVTGIDKEVEPLLLPGAMAVLSLGRLVTEHGYDFVWRKGRSPYLLSPEGKKLKRKVHNNCL